MLKKIILWIVIILVLLLVVVAIAINPLLSWTSSKAFNKLAPGIVGTPTHVDEISVSVYQGRIEIDDLFVGNPEGFSSDRAFSLDKIALEVEPASLFGQTIRVEEISISNPTIIVEYAAGKINLAEIQKHLKSRRAPKAAESKSADKPAEDKSAADTSAAKEKAEGRKLSVNKIALTDADVQIVINGKSHKIESPDIVLENVAPEGVSAGELSLLIIEKILGQVKVDAAQLSEEFGKQITSELEQQLQQATEQGHGLLRQLEQDSGVQPGTVRNLLGL